MAQAPISPFDADAKAIQALVVKEEKSSKGYRESVYNLMVVLYETGLKYENTESVIDGWLAQHDLVQKRGKESSLWNKICKVAFCFKGDDGTYTFEPSKVSKYGSVLESAHEAKLTIENAKEHFSGGLVKRLKGEKKPKEADDEKVQKAIDKLSSRLEGAIPDDIDISVNLEKAGIEPGRHKMFVDIDAKGKLKLLGFSREAEDAVLKELEAEGTERKGKTSSPYDGIARCLSFALPFTGKNGFALVRATPDRFELNYLQATYNGIYTAWVKGVEGIEFNGMITGENLRAIPKLVKLFGDQPWGVENIAQIDQTFLVIRAKGLHKDDFDNRLEKVTLNPTIKLQPTKKYIAIEIFPPTDHKTMSIGEELTWIPEGIIKKADLKTSEKLKSLVGTTEKQKVVARAFSVVDQVEASRVQDGPVKIEGRGIDEYYGSILF